MMRAKDPDPAEPCRSCRRRGGLTGVLRACRRTRPRESFLPADLLAMHAALPCVCAEPPRVHHRAA